MKEFNYCVVKIGSLYIGYLELNTSDVDTYFISGIKLTRDADSAKMIKLDDFNTFKSIIADILNILPSEIDYQLVEREEHESSNL